MQTDDVEGATLESRIDALLERMTLAEKLGQMTQGRGGADQTGPAIRSKKEAAVRSGSVGSFLGVTGAAETRQLQRVAVTESRLGIPLLFAFDVIHGWRTIFPMPLAEAASWNLERIERSARIAAIEATASGVHWTYAPMVDISRDPRWGRVVEGAGEDPFLAGEIAAARVRGFQGEDPAATDTLLATAKHFVAYGGAEGGRDYAAADLSERTLHETYLPPFRAAIDAGVHGVMAAFNDVDGMPAHGSRALLHDLLRDRMGFDGTIVSDYDGVRELMVHGVAATPADAAALALDAGIDIDMVSGLYAESLPAALAAGSASMDAVDAAVRRVLRMKFLLGLFEDPYRYSDPERERANVLTEAHLQASREMAAESIVLLKNRAGTLPLHFGTEPLDVRGDDDADAAVIDRIALIGPLADDARSMLGGWAMGGRAHEAVSVLDGLRVAVPGSVTIEHEPGTSVRGGETDGIAAAVAVARRADVAVLVVGETWNMTSEANNRVSLELPGAQDALARAIVATGTPVVAVLVNGRPLSLPWLDRHADAVVEAWFLGNRMGNAVADVLTGAVNPGGKLPVTFPRSVGQVPIYYAQRRSGRPNVPGEPYVVRYIDSPVTPLYPFGHGLSYTSFGYDDIALDREVLEPGDVLNVSATITNEGERRGTEIVQLYTSDVVASLTRPVRELKGFQRIELAPGESRRVVFELRPADLAFPDADFSPVAEAGEFVVRVARSSVDGLEARFTLAEDWRPASGGDRTSPIDEGD